MHEEFGNIWNYLDYYDAVVITTNGYVKKNGEAVMGRGIALEFAQKYPKVPRLLGDRLKETGNIPYLFLVDVDTDIVTLPVKHVWWQRADIGLIESSIKILVELADQEEWDHVLMPCPGCGNGGLKWEQVKPVIEPYLDDRFTVMEKY